MADSNYYKFADIIWKIDPHYPFLENLLAPFEVQTLEGAVFIDAQADGEMAESELVLRNINDRLLFDFNGIMIHAAAIIFKNKAYLLAAPSGTGKTTQIMLLKQNFEDDIEILCGDKPFIRFIDDTPIVYGSPWMGKEGFGSAKSAPLAGIYLVTRANECSIEKADFSKMLSGIATALLSQQSFEGRLKNLNMVEKICKSADVFIFNCTKEKESAFMLKAHLESRSEI